MSQILNISFPALFLAIFQDFTLACESALGGVNSEKIQIC